MRLRDVGEFDLIERMAQLFSGEGAVVADATTAFSRLQVGIGDDAAVWEEAAGRFSIATTDAMVEGVHFSHGTTGWYDLGWKAMASNISDIAGMGGAPRYALVALGASGDAELEDVLSLCRGMADLAGKFGTAIVGGDTVASPVTVITITLLGETAMGRRGDGSLPLLSRFAARPGDLIAVTGRLGSSAGGLELLLHGSGAVSERFAPLLQAHRRPLPRVREGQLLVESGLRCGMDLSDGLAGDLKRICRASGVSAVVNVARLPMDPLLRECFGERAVELALSGGEDYELLCAGPEDAISRAQLLLHDVGTDLTVVGELQAPRDRGPEVMLVDESGRRFAPERSGWEHFAVGGNGGPEG